jgi:hypothetical protein
VPFSKRFTHQNSVRISCLPHPWDMQGPSTRLDLTILTLLGGLCKQTKVTTRNYYFQPPDIAMCPSHCTTKCRSSHCRSHQRQTSGAQMNEHYTFPRFISGLLARCVLRRLAVGTWDLWNSGIIQDLRTSIHVELITSFDWDNKNGITTHEPTSKPKL